jgi:hypothetical protein
VGLETSSAVMACREPHLEGAASGGNRFWREPLLEGTASGGNRFVGSRLICILGLSTRALTKQCPPAVGGNRIWREPLRRFLIDFRPWIEHAGIDEAMPGQRGTEIGDRR